MHNHNKEIIDTKMGKIIEKEFNIEEDIKKKGVAIIKIDDIKKRIPKYSAGNGHSSLRDGSRGGKRISYLAYKYDLKKNHKNENDKNSSVESLEFRNKKQNKKK
ncbi:hypothetical protein [uncultured Brachyspira sp.]|uniref:hypothetical protein n=1 Tax=uncultured Brachyspira sp. TaxID=221953 RepID=UPI00258780DE|nr:hypothetical protein [uncultured Brachyspira sp.]